MAFIRHIPPSEAAGRLAHVYREIRAEVPRVPNLMQVFSLRPETMESIYHSWLASMWNGKVDRRTKELLAVAISRIARCDYCAETHMIFLQATGMDGIQAFDVERKLADADCLTPSERAAIRFAKRLTSDPRGLPAADVAEFSHAWPDPAARVEIVSVIAAFNAITRIANALGVALEIPAALRKYERSRRGAISLLSRLTALSVDLSEKSMPGRMPEENRHAVERLFLSDLGFDGVPPGFGLLETCPELFDGQIRTIERAVAVVPRERWMCIGLIVGRLTGCDYFSVNCSAWLAQRGVDADDVIAASEGVSSHMSDAEECCLRFTRDLTLHSHTIGQERIDALRETGFSDGAILDLAYVGGILNGMTRLVRALEPLSAACALDSARR
ncbi:MAG: carboxymuconolactone decarboxylase family protein [Gammaproteobacteria bacterium]